MYQTRSGVALAAAALLAVAGGTLFASEAVTNAAAPLTVVAASPKADRLDVGRSDRNAIDVAFELLADSPKAHFRVAPASAEATRCLPACSTTVYKADRPGQPSRLVPGSETP